MEIYNGLFSVYCHINKTNGKIYIGISKNVKLRWRGNGKNYCLSPRFYNAIKKYGWDGFLHEVIASNLTRELACNMLKKLILKMNATNPKYGYNISEGGDYFVMNDLMKAKLAVLAKLRFTGYKHTKLHNKKISLKRISFSGAVDGKHRIICVLTGIEYESVSDASRNLNIPHSSISNVLTGKRYHTHNLHFVYAS